MAAIQMWLASLMSSGLLEEADDAKLIKKFICNPGLLDVMWPNQKGGADPKKTKEEVKKLCGVTDDTPATDDDETAATNPNPNPNPNPSE